ncbi:MAG: 4-hydroxy-tetrahydrodipicolinate synthase [Candidatus Peregrinibacteria bacterium]
MSAPLFSGTYTALVTPFQQNGEIDYGALCHLLQEQLEAKVTGVIVLGTTGESPTITHEEAQSIIEAAVALGHGRMKIIVGTGSNDTAKTIQCSKEAKELGADGLLIVNPYYSKPTQEGLYRHFSLIADTVDLPQIVYNIRGRTGVNVETPTLLRLAEHPRIVGVKEASGDILQMMDVLRQAPPTFAVLSGDDALTFPLLAAGGHGVISVLSNIVPAKVKQMVDAGLRGDLLAARTLHYELLPLMQGCFFETNPLPVKTALALQGKVQEVFRLPMCPMQPSIRQRWQALLDDYRLLPIVHMQEEDVRMRAYFPIAVSLP